MIGKHPVLKPREVIGILEKLGFVEVRLKKVPTSNFDILMAEQLLSHSIRDETSHQS